MNTDRADEAIRSLYRRLEPQVNTEGFCQTIGTKLAARKAGTTRRHTVRVALVACLAIAFVAVAGVSVYEALTHLGQPQEVLVITDEPVTSGGYVGAQAGLLSNPYPTAEAAESSDSSAEIPSAWAESLGKAILDLYPDSGWTVLRAVEVGGSLMDVSLGPDTTSYGPPSLDGTPLWDTQGRPGIRVQVNREESGHFPQEGNPMQYQEFATEYGHGLLGPVYNYGAGSQSILTWFIRPDKLFLRVSAGQVPSEAAESGPLLDEASVQKLVEYMASIIEMAEVGSVQETTTTSAPAEAAGSASASPTSTTPAPSGPKLSWGETATLESRTVTVSKPVEDPDASGAHPEWKTYYSIVTITNTGDDPLNYTASEFTLEGNSSGSVGIGAPGIVGDSNPTVGGEPLLKAGTLEPGRSITAAVRFSLDGKDVPVKVRLGTATSTAVTLASWQYPGAPAAVGDWPVNARGQTYGSNIDVGPENEPDLILVEATNGKTGYSLKTDLDGPMPKTPEEALAWQEARKGQPPREIPVYLSDGVTKIGVFLIGP
jgi:hypothetical protein